MKKIIILLLISIIAVSLPAQTKRKKTIHSTWYYEWNSQVLTKVTGDSLWLYSTNSALPIFVIDNEYDGTAAGQIHFRHNRATPADGTELGVFRYYGTDDGTNEVLFAEIIVYQEDVSENDIAGKMDFLVEIDDVQSSMIVLDGYNGSVGEGHIEINKDQKDVDFEINYDSGSAFYITGSTGATDVVGAFTAGSISSDEDITATADVITTDIAVGDSLWIVDSSDADTVSMSHDGTDFNITGDAGTGAFNLNKRTNISVSGSSIGLKIDGNKTTGNLAEFINDNDGSAGDSTAYIDKLGVVHSQGLTLTNAATLTNTETDTLALTETVVKVDGKLATTGTIHTSATGVQTHSSDITHGGMILKTYSASASITANHTITIQVNVPDGSKIMGAQLHVKTALAGGETWNAQYVTGATATIAAAAAVTQNTNVSTFFDANAATDIASDEVDITIQRSSNPGVDNFTAQGEIEAVVYAYIFDTWDSE